MENKGYSADAGEGEKAGNGAENQGSHVSVALPEKPGKLFWV